MGWPRQRWRGLFSCLCYNRPSVRALKPSPTTALAAPKTGLGTGRHEGQNMKNIVEILREHGIELADDKAKEIEKAVHESYRTVAEFDGKVAKLDAANARVSELEAQAGELSEQLKALDAEKGANAEAVSALQAKVAAYEQAEADRAAKAKEAESRAAFDGLFAEALDGREFASPILKDAVADRAYKMHGENPAMGIADIIEAVTKDGGDVWKNAQLDPKNMPPAGKGGTASGLGINSIEDVKRLTPKQINENWGRVSEILNNQRK